MLEALITMSYVVSVIIISVGFIHGYKVYEFNSKIIDRNMDVRFCASYGIWELLALFAAAWLIIGRIYI